MSNHLFTEYVTGTSFNLTLSKGQIFALDCLVTDDQERLIADGRFMMYLLGLQRRGLVSHDPSFNPITGVGKRAWSVTRAGELAYQLCCEAGLVNQQQTLSEVS